MDAREMDEAMLHAQRKIIKNLTKFFIKFYGTRIPTEQELVTMFGVPETDAAQVLYLMVNGEGE